MIVANERVSADIYCDEDTAAMLMTEFEKVRTKSSWARLYIQKDADKFVDHRVSIHNLPANVFYKLVDQFQEHIYE
jgi:hypothetical protein